MIINLLVVIFVMLHINLPKKRRLAETNDFKPFENGLELYDIICSAFPPAKKTKFQQLEEKIVWNKHKNNNGCNNNKNNNGCNNNKNNNGCNRFNYNTISNLKQTVVPRFDEKEKTFYMDVLHQKNTKYDKDVVGRYIEYFTTPQFMKDFKLKYPKVLDGCIMGTSFENNNVNKIRFHISWNQCSLEEKNYLKNFNLNSSSLQPYIRIFTKEEVVVKNFLNEFKLMFWSNGLKKKFKIYNKYERINTKKYLMCKCNDTFVKVAAGDCITTQENTDNNTFGFIIKSVSHKNETYFNCLTIYEKTDGFVFIKYI